MKIKFGTDGWRAVIGKEYTFYNVARVSEGVARWLDKTPGGGEIIIGYDCRFNGKLFAMEAAKVLAHRGYHVRLSGDFVSTPMVSLAVLQREARLGIVITASHNPPEYNGYKLKGSFGGPLPRTEVDEVEALIPDRLDFDPQELSFEDLLQAGWIKESNLEKKYLQHVREHFDLDAIAHSGFRFAFDAMYGSGQRVLSQLLPDTECLHCEYNPSFKGVPPEPLARNLQEFQQFVSERPIDCGLATDGDADRIALVDADGRFIDAHHIILILIHYLKGYRKLDGGVVTAVSSSNKIAQLCEHYGLHLDVVKIGFKYTSELMRTKDVLVGGEESGGIAVKGHIPERDGIWMGLIIWEFMSRTGKTLRQIIDEIYALVGSFAFERRDLRLSEEAKQRIVNNCENGKYSAFGEHKVQRVDTLDGFKYILNSDTWVMIRPSGTEPVLRMYAEAPTREEVTALLDTVIESV
ncbi:MAG: phosphoglucomutase/phosphomannomutase family protein [Cryomorphaceae bacterium]|nr:MAG: phosphoglucomutase/phosphomannomutase family protein [Cryomorphaceae bacterium]